MKKLKDNIISLFSVLCVFFVGISCVSGMEDLLHDREAAFLVGFPIGIYVIVLGIRGCNATEKKRNSNN